MVYPYCQTAKLEREHTSRGLGWVQKGILKTLETKQDPMFLRDVVTWVYIEPHPTLAQYQAAYRAMRRLAHKGIISRTIWRGEALISKCMSPEGLTYFTILKDLSVESQHLERGHEPTL